MTTAAARLPYPKPLVPQDLLRRAAPIDLFWRAVAARVRAGHEPVDRLFEREGFDDRVLLELIIKTASAPANTSSSGWASQLVSSIAQQWTTSLVPSAFAQLAPRGLSLSFGEGALPAIASRDATPTVAGAFVGEGQPIPTKQLAFSSTPLTPKKMGCLVGFTSELARTSQPNCEAILRDEITNDSAVVLDNTLLDATAATSTRPAGLRAGVSGLTPSPGGGTAALVADVKQLLAGLGSGSVSPVLIANAQQASSLTAYYRDGLAVISTPNMPAGQLLAIDAAAFVVAASAPSFQVSRDAVLHSDTAPTDITSGAGPAAAALTAIAAPTRSYFQTDTVALRMIFEINWLLRRPGAVSWLTGGTW